MNGIEYLLQLHEVCHFTSSERSPSTASNSELRRWLNEGVLRINGQVVKAEDQIPQPVTSVILWARSKRRGRCTIL